MPAPPGKAITSTEALNAGEVRAWASTSALSSSLAAWLLNPSDLAALLKANLVAFIDGKHRIAGFPAYASRHVAEGKFLFLDPSVIRTVYWDAPQLLIDRYSSGKSISGAVELILMNLADIAVIHPARIAVGSA